MAFVRFAAWDDDCFRLKWADVDWQQTATDQFVADGMAKNRKSRVVDFNPQLETHLRGMSERKAPDSDWLFPSPQRGKQDLPAKSFVETMRLVRTAPGVRRFGFHDLRHYFISYCVMAGIDFMTIAKWVGHQDGGILIGKVYGHLSNEHAQRRELAKVNFGPVALPDSRSASPSSIFIDFSKLIK